MGVCNSHIFFCKEIAKLVNDILDLVAERASELIRALAAIKPMSDTDINNMGISSLENFYDGMLPTLYAEGEA